MPSTTNQSQSQNSSHKAETQMGQQESSNAFNQEVAANTSNAATTQTAKPVQTNFSLPKGWGGQEMWAKKVELAKSSLQDFFVAKGESVNFQILDSEPCYLPSHTVQHATAKGFTLYATFVCQTHNPIGSDMEQDYCRACLKQQKQNIQYYLRVYDVRGKYEEKKFSGTPTVKLWKPSNTLVTTLREIAEKFQKLKNLPLNEIVFTLSRNEAGTFLTRAVDDMNGGFIAPFALSQPILDVIKKPLTDVLPYKSDADLALLGI